MALASTDAVAHQRFAREQEVHACPRHGDQGERQRVPRPTACADAHRAAARAFFAGGQRQAVGGEQVVREHVVHDADEGRAEQ